MIVPDVFFCLSRPTLYPPLTLIPVPAWTASSLLPMALVRNGQGTAPGKITGKEGKLSVFICFLHLSEAVLQLAVSLQLLAPPWTLPWGPISACTPQAKECSHFHCYWPQWTAYSSLFLSTVPTPFLIVSLQFPQIIQWASLPVSTVTVTVKKVGCVVAGGYCFSKIDIEMRKSKYLIIEMNHIQEYHGERTLY